MILIFLGFLDFEFLLRPVAERTSDDDETSDESHDEAREKACYC